MRFTLLILAISQSLSCAAEMNSLSERIDQYMQPYVDSQNFSGSILIARGDNILINTAYGTANIEHETSNRSNTVYHIASVSKPFTAIAIMILAERKALRLDAPVSTVLPECSLASRVTLHQLLSNTSGIPNINNTEQYPSLEKFAQTPDSLAAIICEYDLLFEPGERYHYSNSNYNLLALIIERASGMSFGEFLTQEIFAPTGMANSQHHGDASMIIRRQASGYEPVGHLGLRKARWIDWTVKTGNGSLVSTTHDLLRAVRAFFSDQLLSTDSRSRLLEEHTENVGYGWFVRERHGRAQFHINGRSPGYSSYLGYYPDEDLTVVVLSNVYNSVTTAVGSALAAHVFREPVEQPLLSIVSLPPAIQKSIVGTYRFSSDFYISNATIDVEVHDGNALLRWAHSGFESALLHREDRRFVDRMFWSDVQFVVGDSGSIVEILYDEFVGKKVD